ncbi:uncharacterized protein LOC110191575 [Drosophila serrata]|uniref:uncharacterized protein LOC110191575 n=1 Tax=Drosophila serrata TaxID=7274 RepID=UPI000A1CF882|nr:uncharacterized protein LOC110191575 [Drosophila serrata]
MFFCIFDKIGGKRKLYYWRRYMFSFAAKTFAGSDRSKMWKLDSKDGIIGSGFVSIAFAIIYLIEGDWYWTSYGFGIHVAGLQILGSIVLIVGAIREKHRLFVPWMATTAIFLYLMIYAGIILLANEDWIIVLIMITPITAYLGFALYAVQKAFRRMRKDVPPAYWDLPPKPSVINPI